MGNNYLTEVSVQRLKDCLSGKTCKTEQEKQSKLEASEKLSQFLDQELANLCAASPTGDACRMGINTAIKYIAMRDAWEYLNNDVSRSSKQTFDYLYNSPNADKRLVTYMNTIDTRADFFGASDRYEQYEGSRAKWFGGAEYVSRAAFTGLGADGNLSWVTFGGGNVIALSGLYDWRQEAGDALMNAGFDNFRNLYNKNISNVIQWDIKQLKEEQAALQVVHKEHLDKTSKRFFNFISESVTKVDILNYDSRVNYGCRLLGYTAAQGCQP